MVWQKLLKQNTVRSCEPVLPFLVVSLANTCAVCTEDVYEDIRSSFVHNSPKPESPPHVLQRQNVYIVMYSYAGAPHRGKKTYLQTKRNQKQRALCMIPLNPKFKKREIDLWG